MTHPAVTVIVPVFNAERHVRETLDSIAGQTLRNLEVIVVDDGSSDASIAIVEEFAARDPRVRLVTGPAQGSAGAARNTGLRLARGDYLAFLDADDLFVPTMLEKLHTKATIDDADIVMTAFSSFSDVTGKPEAVGRRGRLHANLLPAKTPFSPQDISDHIFTAPHTTVWNKMYKADYVRRIGLQFEPVRRSNDAYFNMMALAQAQALSYVDEPLVLYRASNKDSLQGSQSEADLSWADATRAVARDLKAKGIYEPFRRAMIQRVATRSFDRLSKATTVESFIEMYDVVRHSLFTEFEVDLADERDFPNPDVGRQVAEFLSLPLTEWLHSTPIGARVRVAGSSPTRATPSTSTIAQSSGSSGDSEHTRDATDRGDQVRRAKKRKPDVTVIVRVRDSSSRIKECLRSVLGQKDVNLQVVCVFSRPPEHILSRLREFARQDSRISLVRVKRGEDAPADTGLAAAKGRYVIEIDSDDRWVSKFLAPLVRQADDAAADAVIFDAFSFLDGDWMHGWAIARPVPPRRRNTPAPRAVPGSNYLPEMRHSRHLGRHAGVMLVNRDHLNRVHADDTADLRGNDSVRTLNILLHSERVLRVHTAVLGRRVRKHQGRAADDAATARSELETYVSLRHAGSNIDVLPAHKEQIDALADAALGRATAHFSKLPRRARQDLLTGSDEPTRLAYRRMADARAAEAKNAR